MSEKYGFCFWMKSRDWYMHYYPESMLSFLHLNRVVISDFLHWTDQKSDHLIWPSFLHLTGLGYNGCPSKNPDIKTSLVVSFSLRVVIHCSPLAAFWCQGSSKDCHYFIIKTVRVAPCDSFLENKEVTVAVSGQGMARSYI